MRARVAGEASRPNLSDVAKHAQVSPSTVSLVLAGKAKERHISDEVILRVQLAAAKLDYSPNMLVQSMQRGKTDIYCFYNCFRYAPSPIDQYMIRLFTAMSRSVGERGRNLLLFCDFSLTADQTYHTLNGGHADGVIIFAPPADDPLLPYLRTSRLPVVLLNAGDESDTLSSIRDDAAGGMRQVADRLIALEHTKIAVFKHDTAWNGDVETRVGLLLEYLGKAGISVPDQWIARVPPEPPLVREALQKLLDGPDTPTALFCWNDALAYMAVEACDRLGIAVPGRLSIVGYDGIAWPSGTRHVVASVHVDLAELAEQAIEILDIQVKSRPAEPIRRLLPAAFKEGSTLGPARSK